MAQTATQPQREIEPALPDSVASFAYSGAAREQVLARLHLLWIRRRFLLRAVVAGFLMATLLAFLIHERFESATRLMPPDSQASGTFALMAGLAGQSGTLSGAASDLLGIKSTGALFVGVLQSRTVQDRIIERFDLKNVYGLPLEQTARQRLAENTGISEDRKSGIITLTVTDRDAKRAALIAGAYVEELNTLMAQLTTSSAHRERVFLEERLNAVKQDLDSVEKDFSQFVSKNAALDITEQGKAMVGAAATLNGQLIAAQSELEGLRQIYTDNNVRVRTVQARIAELRNQLQKLDGKSANALSNVPK